MAIVRIAAGLALALAFSAQGYAAPKKSEAGADPNREICKSRPVVGSRLQRIRECHTAAEWQDMELQEQLGMNRQQYNGAHGQAPPELNLPARMAAQQQPN